ncbi:Curlin associated repeat-containing protein [Cohaesibacter sp. ES.047]|uniref:hypothetical protein n=1 Tax=Cohaesibacter sp. ES.047 TaxID=1798205 RepID=UPI000BB9A293|nr:hypothetical protein [Cohaesibacter sp. ES.047]SNY93691.1 Curlin associated repeat-containing protein [Cohaesibacter sp. ES.047]
MTYMRSPFLSTAFLSLIATSAARADDNEVYIGQTGNTNTVIIDQLGSGNLVGSNDDSIFVSQVGSYNTLSVDQTGYDNEAGAAPSAGALNLLGIYQNGDRNEATISQKNDNPLGTNLIGAISQNSATLRATTANTLSITQTDISADGTTGTGNGQGNHVIGEILQVNTGGASNSLTISQFDGTTSGGEGNRVQTVIQQGSDNLAIINQEEEGNEVTELRQLGASNEATIYQQDGVNNLVNSLTQDGDNNRARAALNGSRNLIFSILQSNALVGSIGNLMTVTLSGDDNGGDGMGGLGQFTRPITQALQVAQGELNQFGDENVLNFVTSGTSSMNLFGFVQDGDGNALSGTVDGVENEVAALEIGDGNRIDFTQDGDQNTIAISYRGDNNAIYAKQEGDENTLDISFDGGIAPITRSNQNNDPAVGGFGDTVAAFAGSLMPGDAVQIGDLNLAKISITAGNQNKIAFAQVGQSNTITGATTGHQNQVLITQTGSLNEASYTQNGNFNSLVIIQ